MRGFKTVNDSYIEPISFIVPRRAETFQRYDIYISAGVTRHSKRYYINHPLTVTSTPRHLAVMQLSQLRHGMVAPTRNLKCSTWRSFTPPRATLPQPQRPPLLLSQLNQHQPRRLSLTPNLRLPPKFQSPPQPLRKRHLLQHLL